MLSYHFFLDLAFILLSTKIFGLITRKISMPQVVGALIAGLVLGPSILNIVHETEFIVKMAELGVILLMFSAGMETDVKELKRTGKASLLIASLGVVVPLIGGFLVAGFFNEKGITNMNTLDTLKAIFIGIILTATSVSITVETLKEMGKLKSSSGTAILGAAVIDDILGIILLTIVISFADQGTSIVSVLLRILLFFVFAAICAVIFNYLFNMLSKKYGKKRRIPIYSLAFCLILSYVAEEFFGIADITGAYLAGIIISNVIHSDYVQEKSEVVSYMILSPIFFASIGIKTHVEGFTSSLILFTVVLLVVALLTKILGCGLAAKMCKYTTKESIQIGVGMISRGEVALIVADKGAQIGLMDEKLFAPLIIVVVVTTLITPILLKIVYNSKQDRKQIQI